MGNHSDTNSSIFVWAECSHALKAAAEDWRRYMQGALPKLEELEGERLPYFGEGETAIENRWQRAISGADLTDTI